jgi:hypothetical protein
VSAVARADMLIASGAVVGELKPIQHTFAMCHAIVGSAGSQGLVHAVVLCSFCCKLK